MKPSNIRWLNSDHRSIELQRDIILLIASNFGRRLPIAFHIFSEYCAWRSLDFFWTCFELPISFASPSQYGPCENLSCFSPKLQWWKHPLHPWLTVLSSLGNFSQLFNCHLLGLYERTTVQKTSNSPTSLVHQPVFFVHSWLILHKGWLKVAKLVFYCIRSKFSWVGQKCRKKLIWTWTKEKHKKQQNNQDDHNKRTCDASPSLACKTKGSSHNHHHQKQLFLSTTLPTTTTATITTTIHQQQQQHEQ